MTGLGIKLYTDEDVDADLAVHLTRQGYDILSCRDAGNAMRALEDEWQLRFAVREKRAILVHNFADYWDLERTWKLRGEEHYGILLIDQIPIGELIRRTQRHLDNFTPEQQYNVLFYLHP